MITNLAATAPVFTSNVFLVEGERPVLIDAGDNFDVVSMVRERVDDLEALVLTHTHPDHIGNVEAVTDGFNVDCWGYDPSHALIDRAIEDGDIVQLGDHEYEALHTPGHAPDHLCFYADDAGILFAGDLIFQNGAFGRVDLPGSDPEALVASIDRIAERVGSSIRELHTGHGPSVSSNAGEHVEMSKRAAQMY